MGKGGVVLTDEKVNEMLRNDDVARAAGIRVATFKKTVVARPYWKHCKTDEQWRRLGLHRNTE